MKPPIHGPAATITCSAVTSSPDVEMRKPCGVGCICAAARTIRPLAASRKAPMAVSALKRPAAFLNDDVPVLREFEGGKRCIGLGAGGRTGDGALPRCGGAGRCDHLCAGRTGFGHLAWVVDGACGCGV